MKMKSIDITTGELNTVYAALDTLGTKQVKVADLRRSLATWTDETFWRVVGELYRFKVIRFNPAATTLSVCK